MSTKPRRRARLVGAAAFVATLSPWALMACGASSPDAPAPAQSPATSSTAPPGSYGGDAVPYGTQVDKARDVQQQADERQKQMEQQGSQP